MFPGKITYQKNGVFETAKLGAVFTTMRTIEAKKSRLVGYGGLFLKQVVEELKGWSELLPNYNYFSSADFSLGKSSVAVFQTASRSMLKYS